MRKKNDVDGALASSFSFRNTGPKKAFQDVFSDMNGSIPMDRLVSGDVGFGKKQRLRYVPCLRLFIRQTLGVALSNDYFSRPTFYNL